MTNTEIPGEAVRLALKRWERVWSSGSYADSRPEDLVRAALEAALPALRKQWAEEVAAKADQIAEGHQKTAEDHRRISLEVGSAEPKGQRHMRTALAFKERAAGAWEAAHAVREFGEGP